MGIRLEMILFDWRVSEASETLSGVLIEIAVLYMVCHLKRGFGTCVCHLKLRRHEPELHHHTLLLCVHSLFYCKVISQSVWQQLIDNYILSGLLNVMLMSCYLLLGGGYRVLFCIF